MVGDRRHSDVERMTSLSVLVLCVAATALAASDHQVGDFDFADKSTHVDDLVPIVSVTKSKNSISVNEKKSLDDQYLADVGSADDEEGSATEAPDVTAYPTSISGVHLFRATINVTSLKYSAQLGNSSSLEFSTLASQLKRAIEQEYETVYGQQTVNIVQFRPGTLDPRAQQSVIVTFELASSGFYNQLALFNVLNGSMNRGLIGQYSVTTDGFTFRSISADVSRTACQVAAEAATQHQSQGARGVYVPQCQDNGEYKPLQFHGSTGYSWCVDRNGNEVPGSRTPPGRSSPSCPPHEQEVAKTHCQLAAERAGLSSPEGPPIGAYIPQCDEQGEYELIQFHGSTGYSWCVDRNGNEIPGTRTPPGRPNPSCGQSGTKTHCQQAAERAGSPQRLGAYIPQCDEQGEYKPLQRHGSTGYSWCVDGIGREVEGTRTAPGRPSPPCPEHGGQFGSKTLCQLAIEHADLLNPEGPRPGVFVPQCDSQGEYVPLQFHGSTGYSWCVDRNGKEIPGTRRSPTEPSSSCSPPESVSKTHCQLAVEDAELGSEGAVGRYVPQCDENGEYVSLQFHPSTGYTWCVDSSGKMIDGTETPPGQPQPVCPPPKRVGEPARTSPVICTQDEFRCLDQLSCVDLQKRCDGRRDCHDVSDELECPDNEESCNPDQFTCNDGSCVDRSQRCNGRNDCVDGSDEHNCSSQRRNCYSSEFQCADGECIDGSYRCDGQLDCNDGSDEDDCPPVTPEVSGCGQSQFQCYDRTCIDNALRCDGQYDCNDGEDESGCVGPEKKECSAGQFTCHNGQCIEVRLQCDGRPDCSDQSDEHGCFSPVQCTLSQFTCGDGSCIDARQRCDRQYDCQDGSDEQDCDGSKCSATEFMCDDNSCIDSRLRCNGNYDCADGTDEFDCQQPVTPEPQTPEPHRTCLYYQFTCDDGSCINENLRCDRHYDCPDGSDEFNCDAITRSPPCQYYEFTCRNGQCIEDALKCNGWPDCADGSDEENCGATAQPTPAGCNLYQFQCRDGSCIEDYQHCDGSADCRDGSDEYNCGEPATPEPRTCAYYQFTCNDGSCIHEQLRCNGQYDCRDGSDEFNCAPTPEPRDTCAYYQFTCSDGSCIEDYLRCNGDYDCSDGSDEYDCSGVTLTPEPRRTCLYYQFTCGDGSCIDDRLKCNGQYDCLDGSDEFDCAPPTRPPCGSGYFTCHDGSCIADYYRCDGRDDCTDGSDEDDCGSSGVVTASPAQLRIREGREASFICQIDGQPASSRQIRWSRTVGALPREATDAGGRLYIPRAVVADSGQYVCTVIEGPQRGQTATVTLIVEDIYGPTQRPPEPGHCDRTQAPCGNGVCIPQDYFCDGDYDCTDRSDEANCVKRVACEPNEFQCSNGKCILKIWQCDGDDDCGGDKSDEQNCGTPAPGAKCRVDEWLCADRQQCILASYHCDGEFDCQDRSDEIGCTPPVVTRPPPGELMLQQGQTAVIECEAIGVPPPLIVWRLNWGHIAPPPRLSTSVETLESVAPEWPGQVGATKSRGVLTIHNARKEDEGAYTCEALNAKGSIFAVPDTIVHILPPSGVCPASFFNSEAHVISECIRCFCFGVSQTCSSSSLFQSQITASSQLPLVNQQTQRTLDGQVVEFSPSSRESSVRDYSRRVRGGNYYWSLPSYFLGNKVTSYGGKLAYTPYYTTVRSQSPSFERGPDVIISGNGITLYRFQFTSPFAGRQVTASVPLTESSWTRDERGQQQGVTREEFMTVLQNIDYILIKSNYDRNQDEVRIGEVSLSSTSSQDVGLGRAALVEQCDCPPGYTGTSCEQCAAGYNRVPGGQYLGQCSGCNCNGHSSQCSSSGQCLSCQHNTEGDQCERCKSGFYGNAQAGTPQDCQPCPCPLTEYPNQFTSQCHLDSDGQVTCYGCPPGYEGRRCERCARGYQGNPLIPGDSCRSAGGQCDARGSMSSQPDYAGQCSCKENVQGRTCSECKDETFYLSEGSTLGCIPCFCMGVTRSCASTNYNRAQVTLPLTSTDPQGLVLSDRQGTESYNGITVNPRTREAIYHAVPDGELYWLLPDSFTGNKLTSYGGNLRFTIQYLPGLDRSRTNYPDVEITGSDIVLEYKHKQSIPINTATPLVVPLYEQHWQREDGTRATREHLMMLLADLKSIKIKAKYAEDTAETRIREVSLDIAENRPTGQEQAYAVEQCHCPPGYRGLSCEECDVGYKRSGGGFYLGICVPDGQDITTPGFKVIVEEPKQQTASIGLSVRFYCRGISQYVHTVSWGRQDGNGRKLSSRAMDDGHGTLTISNVQREDEGTYVCTGSDFTYNTATDYAVLTVRGDSPYQPPNVRVERDYIEANPGEVVELRCIVSGYPTPNVEWIHDGGYLPSDADTQNGYLRFRASKESEGQYECRASSSAGSDYRTVRVVLQGLQPPNVRFERDYVEANTGDEVALHCIVSGYPAPNIQWSRTGGVLPIDAVIENGYLRFRATKESEGHYECHGSNSVGSDYGTVRLVVQDSSPEFEVIIDQPSITVRPGEDARFDCSARGTVDVDSIEWSKRGDRLPQGSRQEGGRLVIPECQPSASGQYICTIYLVNGDSKVAYTTLVVDGSNSNNQQVAPSVRIEPDRLTVTQGRTATIYCTVTGEPAPIIRWSKSGEELGPNHQVVGNVLRILDVQPEDRGHYICEAENLKGRSEAAVYVDIEYHEQPELEIYPEPVVTLQTGDSFEFSCRAIRGTPAPVITWTRANHEALTRNTEVTPDGTLRLTSVSAAEQGQYICTASSPAGTVTATATVQIQGEQQVVIKQTSPHRVTAGEALILECSAEGYPPPRVIWRTPRGTTFPESYPPQGGSSYAPGRAEGQGTALLHLSPVSVNDAGTYTCIVLSATGQSESRIEVLVEASHLETVQIEANPRQLRVSVGSTVEFQCHQALPVSQPVNIQWSKSGGTLPVTHYVHDGTLRITDVKEEDAGVYKCIARGTYGTAEASVRLEILVPPVVTINSQTQTLRPGDLFQVQCDARDSATGQPVAVRWSRLDGQLSPAATEYDGLLEILAVTAQDAGRYECTAANDAGQAYAVFELVIFAPPSAIISPRTISIAAGQTVEFRCDVTGSPHPRIQWLKDNGPVLARHSIQAGTLTLYDVTSRDSGRYDCIVTNEVGTTRDNGILRVSGSSEGTAAPDEFKTVTLGDRVEMNCDVRGGQPGVPRPTVRWSKVDGVMSPQVRVDGSHLTIHRATQADQGTYRCTVTTATAGTFYKQYIITVEAPPMIPVRRQTRTVAVGARATLTCQAQGNPPPYVAWSKRSGELPRDHSVNNSILVLPNLREDDFGEYVCVARNKFGYDEATVVLVAGELIPYFDQNPLSYISYPVIREAYRTFDIEISFRPQASDGLILYNGQMADGTGDFVSFGLRDRSAEFRLDVGSGPAIITSDPLQLNKWYTVRIKRDGRDGAMYIGDSVYKGQAPGAFVGLDLTENLFVGSVPNFQRISRAAGFSQGFTGCISRLVISGRPVNLGAEILDTVGVSSCPVCQDRPCKHGGSCVNALTDVGYRCVCPRGYSGTNCELTGDRCTPASCGATGRCHDLTSGAGYRCVCPLGLSGRNCEAGDQLVIPQFNATAFAAYPTIRDAIMSVQIKLVFKAISLQDGLLLYNAYDPFGSGDFIALSIKDNHIVFQFDTGSGPANLQSREPIEAGKWITVIAERSRQDGSLIVNDQVAVKGQAPSNGGVTPGPTVGLNLKTPLYVGGVDWTDVRVSPFVGVDVGFHGCISDLSISGLAVDLIHGQIASKHVSECENGHERACGPQSCQNGGTCYDLGDDAFQCHCPLGFSGTTCGIRAPIETAAQFAGKGSYIELPSRLLPHRSNDAQETIELTLITTQENALLFWHGQMPTTSGHSKDYIAIAIENGRPVVSYELGSGPANITGTEIINDGEQHTLVFTRTGQSGSLEVDQDEYYEGKSGGTLVGLNTVGNIYIGGVPDARLMTDGKFIHPFVGCISDVILNSNGPLNFSEHAVRGVNVQPCFP